MMQKETPVSGGSRNETPYSTLLKFT